MGKSSSFLQKIRITRKIKKEEDDIFIEGSYRDKKEMSFGILSYSAFSNLTKDMSGEIELVFEGKKYFVSEEKLSMYLIETEKLIKITSKR